MYTERPLLRTLLAASLFAMVAAVSAHSVETSAENEAETTMDPVVQEAAEKTDVASPGPIVTDRPTDSASPALVPPGTFQLELGYKFSRINASSTRIDAQLFPDLLARYGVNDKFEFRFVAQGWNFQDGDRARSDGFSDISLGAKIALAEEQGSRAQVSLLVDVSLPIGSRQFSSDYVIPKLLLLGGNALTERLDLTWNIGPSFVTAKRNGNRETDIDLNYALALSGPVGEGGRFGLFGEFYGAFATGSGLPDRHNFQIGTTILLSPLFQIDFRGGAGLVNNEPDWLVGAGLAFRVPR